MGDLADIMDGLADTVQGVYGAGDAGTVVYTTAAGTVIAQAAPASVGKTDFELDNGQGVAVAYQSRDYLIKTGDLANEDGTPYEPQRGDIITEIQAGVTYTYTVMLPDAKANIWKWSDPARRIRRIYTKQTGVV